MTTTRSALRALTTVLAAALTTVTFAGLASADTPAVGETSAPATAIYQGPGVGYNKVIDGHAAGTIELNASGAAVSAFCIEYGVDQDLGGTYNNVSWTDSGVTGLPQAADIATRHNSIGTPLPDARSENAAAQLAIWHFTDNVDFSVVDNASIVTRASTLVAAAGSAAAPAVPAQLKLTRSGDTVTAAMTPAQANATVTFTVDGADTAVTTNASGVATLNVPAASTEKTIAAKLASVLPAGSVMDPPGKQKVILLAATPVTLTAQIAIPAAPATQVPVPVTTATTQALTTTAATTTTKAAPAKTKPVAKTTAKATAAKVVKAPVTTTSKSTAAAVHASNDAPTKLPYTGGWVQPWMFLAALAVAGAGLFLYRKMAASRTR